MKILLRFTLFLIAGVMLASCADKKTEGYREREQKSFDLWMTMYVKDKLADPTKLERLDNGVYILWIEKNENPSPSDLVDETNWIRINYTGTTFPDKDYSEGRGRVFTTRDSLVAKQENTFSTYAHYVPQFIPFSKSTRIPLGMYEAILQQKVKKGDKVRLYIPASLSTAVGGFVTSNGFGGSYSAVAGVPIIIDSLEIVDLIDNKDVVTRENKIAADYAIKKWGLDTAKNKILTNFYFYQKLNDPAAEKVKKEDDKKRVAKMWFVGKFTDGFVFDTNIDSIGRRFRRDTTTYAAMNYNPSSTSSFVKAFQKLTDTVYYDSYFKMVFTSEFGYGATGQSVKAPSTIIQPYTPLLFEVWVEKQEKNPDEGKDKKQ